MTRDNEDFSCTITSPFSIVHYTATETYHDLYTNPQTASYILYHYTETQSNNKVILLLYVSSKIDAVKHHNATVQTFDEFCN